MYHQTRLQEAITRAIASLEELQKIARSIDSEADRLHLMAGGSWQGPANALETLIAAPYYFSIMQRADLVDNYLHDREAIR